MRESAIVRRIKQAVLKEYPTAWVIKIADRFTRFLPDLLIQYRCGTARGATLYVETKAKDGVLSEGQKVEHHKIRLANGDVILARNAKTVLEALERRGAD